MVICIQNLSLKVQPVLSLEEVIQREESPPPLNPPTWKGAFSNPFIVLFLALGLLDHLIIEAFLSYNKLLPPQMDELHNQRSYSW